MPRTRTLAQLRARARVLADAVTSTNTSDAEANVEINEAIAELWDLECKADPKRHMRRVVLTASSGVRSYDFAAADFSPTAADFYSLVGVKYIGTDNEEEPLQPFEFHDDGPLERRPQQYPHSYGALVRYDVRYSGIAGADVRLVFDADPEPGPRYAVYYTRAAPTLASDLDAFDGVNGWEEWVALRVAIRIRDREETDTSVLQAELARAYQRITTMAPQRDAGRSKQVASVWARSMGHRRMRVR